MNNFLISIFFVLAVSFSFIAGSLWQKNKFKEMPVYNLKNTIALQSSPDEIGSLPRGAKLYLYRELPEVKTYIAFVNIDLGGVVLERESLDGFYVSPISGYAVDIDQ